MYKNTAIESQRAALVRRLEHWMEIPLFILGLGWLALVIVELVGKLTPVLEFAGLLIWVVFLCDFAMRFAVAPDKLRFFRKNLLTAISLFVPALRVLRITRVARLLRAARAVRGLRFVRLITSFNRGMRALSATLGRRGFGYVSMLSTLVTILGAAGMFAFEKDVPAGGIDSYGTALWWTAMLMTTMGTEYWPQTGEGRLLCLLLALYAFGVFGYVTAIIATFFIGRDADDQRAEIAGAKQIEMLSTQIALLRGDMAAIREQTANQRRGNLPPREEDA